jgi:hypothetical protein
MRGSGREPGWEGSVFPTHELALAIRRSALGLPRRMVPWATWVELPTRFRG